MHSQQLASNRANPSTCTLLTTLAQAAMVAHSILHRNRVAQAHLRSVDHPSSSKVLLAWAGWVAA
jgi:hypothetical protein